MHTYGYQKTPKAEASPGANAELEKACKRPAKGDKIFVAEVSRLGGSPLQVLEILEAVAKREIAVHIVKSQLIMNGSLQSTIIATVLGLAAQIEREFISVRTKEALAKRKYEALNWAVPEGMRKTSSWIHTES